MRKRIAWWSLAPLAAIGCGDAAESELAAEAREHAVVAAAPRLYRYLQTTDGVSETRYVAEVPRDGATPLLLRLLDCRDERVVREMFGLRQSPIAERNDLVIDENMLVIACADRIAADAHVAAEPRTLGVSRLEYRLDGESAGSAPGRYFVIPNRCAGLMKHFAIPDRVRRAPAPPLGGVGWTPPPDATPIELACADERPAVAYEGWQVHTALVPSLGFRSMLLVENGNTSFFVDALDGRPYNDVDENERALALSRLRSLLSVPRTVASNDDVVEDERIVPGDPLVDVCLDRCDTAGWIPAHKVVRDGYLECESGTLDELTGECAGGERRDVMERLELDGTLSRRAPLGDVALDLGICTASDTWERRLGLTRRDQGGTWMQRLIDAYNAGKSTATAPRSFPLPCLVPARTCSVALSEGADLSTTTVAGLTRSCRAGDEVLEIRVGRQATISRQAFTLDAAALPPAMRTVRLLGDAAGSTVTVAPPSCGFGTSTACTEPQPALAFQGDLTVDLEHLRLVARAAATPAPLARVAVQASGSLAGGLVLRAHDVHIAGGEAAPVFYKGIVFSGGTLALYDTSVRAFTDALSAERARLSAVSWPIPEAYSIESLAQPGLPSASLVDLRGRWLGGSVANFRALSLGAEVQAFLVGMRVAGPTAVSWSDDRATWTERGLLSVDSRFTRAAGYFERESVMLSVSGRGQLDFVAPAVVGFGHVLRCPSYLSGGTATITFDRPVFDQITYALRQGACTFESASRWVPTGL